MTSRKLAHYFQAHQVVVYTNSPLREILRKADLSGRVSKWGIELSAYDIQFSPHSSIKGQVLADFVTEFTNLPSEKDNDPPPEHHKELRCEDTNILYKDDWIIWADGSSKNKGAEYGIVLKSPNGDIFEHSVSLKFEATNNEIEYEAAIAGVSLAKQMGAKKAILMSDSQIVVKQWSGEYTARGESMTLYH